MEELTTEMKLRGFSQRTMKSYIYHVNDFLEYCGQYDKCRKKEYILYLISQGKDPNTVRLAAAAIDFYTKAVIKEMPEHIELPKRKKRLPDVLTKEQIKAMINALTNIKHQLIIEILYSSGLRLSELIDLHTEDINFEDSIIRVRQGKGSKDRLTIISKQTASKIKQFKKAGYIFEGRNGKYSAKSVQLVLENAARKAGIMQKVTPHMLRHSFATHLLEQGIDIRYIQALLGHSRLQTTQIYTHVAKTQLTSIKNPLDT